MAALGMKDMRPLEDKKTGNNVLNLLSRTLEWEQTTMKCCLQDLWSCPTLTSKEPTCSRRAGATICNIRNGRLDNKRQITYDRITYNLGSGLLVGLAFWSFSPPLGPTGLLDSVFQISCYSPRRWPLPPWCYIYHPIVKHLGIFDHFGVVDHLGLVRHFLALSTTL